MRDVRTANVPIFVRGVVTSPPTGHVLHGHDAHGDYEMRLAAANGEAAASLAKVAGTGARVMVVGYVTDVDAEHIQLQVHALRND